VQPELSVALLRASCGRTKVISMRPSDVVAADDAADAVARHRESKDDRDDHNTMRHRRANSSRPTWDPGPTSWTSASRWHEAREDGHDMVMQPNRT